MKILIVRHGEPDYSIDSLTEKGWREAEFLSQKLTKMPIDDFYCSPLGRAQDTAKPTLKKLGRTAETLPWLAEFRGTIASPFSGSPRICWDLPPSYWTKFPKLYDPKTWYEAEPFLNSNCKEIWEETTTGVDELLNRYGMVREGDLYRNDSEKTIVLFCHFALGATVLAYLTGLSPAVLWHNFCFLPSSTTLLATETDSSGLSHFRTLYIGDVSHLYAMGEEPSLMAFYPSFDY